MESARETHWVGVDWGDAAHAVCVLNEQGKEAAAFEVPHTPEGLQELVERLRRVGEIAGVAVETTRSLMVQKLLDAGLAVYPVNPKLSHAWRAGWKVAEPKSDPSDAWMLAEGLRQHHARLRSFKPDDDLTRELRLLCEDECELIRQRTALVCQLQAALKAYYPQAIEWFDDWTVPSAWDFVLTFPTPEALRNASRKRRFGFLKTHHIGLSPIWQERVERSVSGPAWPSDAATTAAKSVLAVALAKSLRTLQASLADYRARIEKLYGDHPDSSLFDSLPGAGPKLAPRLLSHFGSDRARFDSPDALEQLSGVSPVTVRSGRSRTIQMRRQCQKAFRNTLHMWAFLTVRESEWAGAFYRRARRAGQGHALALRNLARKWLGILYRMWRDRKPYDEGRYLTSLIRHGSPLVLEIRNLQPSNTGG
jgi:transposase